MNFIPVRMITHEPYKEIKNISKNKSVEEQFLDFKILEIQTFYTNSKNKNEVKLQENELVIFDDDNFFLDESLKIWQKYEIEIFDTRQKKQAKLPKISIGVNSSLTNIVANIAKTNQVIYEKDYDRLLYEYIMKQLIKVRVLVGIREKKLKNELSKISSVLRIKEEIDKNYSFVVTSAIDSIKSQDAQIIFLYKDKINNLHSKDKIDYASRGFLMGVVEDELIIEQTNAKIGRAGRNVRGEYMPVAEPKQKPDKEIIVSENIEIVQDDEGIKFYAKKSGFISEENGIFDIKDQIEINEVNFKSTGSIETGLDSNVTLVIKEDDVIKDAIGTGVIVEVNELDVRGNVGANAIINANKVLIGGQTHAKTKIKAKTAKIQVHIGHLEAQDVEIQRLEGGTVIAQKVNIQSALGGNIIANEIKINTLASNSILIAENLIEIENLKGTNNKLIIDSSKMPQSENKFEIIFKKMDKLKIEINDMPKQIEQKKIIIDENKNSIHTIKNKIEELKNSGIIPPITFMKKIKEYQQLVYEYNNLLKDLNDKKIELESLKKDIDNMQNSIFSSKIVCKTPWIELNEIKFVLMDPPKEIVYISRQNEIAKIISLNKIEKDDKTDFEIKKSNNMV